MEIPGLLQPSSLSEVPTVKDPDVAIASSLPNILSLTISTARLKSCGASCSIFIAPQHGATVANIVLSDYTKEEYQNAKRKTSPQAKRHKPSLLLTSLIIFTSLTIFTS